MKLTRGSPHAHLQGAAQLSGTIAEILRGYLLASVTMPEGVPEEGFNSAIDNFVGSGSAGWHLPPALMLDFVDNNFAQAIAYLESARTKIANAAIEELAPDFDTQLEELMREEDEET